MENKDFLNGWREENGIGAKKHYAGGCEGDATADAIREYMLAEERKRTAVENAKPELENTDETAEVEVAEIDGEDLTQ